MWPAGYWWTYYENTSDCFPDPAFYVLRGSIDVSKRVFFCPLLKGFLAVFISSTFQGTPSGARHLSVPLVFSPLLLLQGAGVLFAVYRFVEKIVIILHCGGPGRYSGVSSGRYFDIASKVQDFFGFLHRGSR